MKSLKAMCFITGEVNTNSRCKVLKVRQPVVKAVGSVIWVEENQFPVR